MINRTDTQSYKLAHEMELIIYQMADAMRNAHLPYVAMGRPTLRMKETLNQYYDWARRAREAGL